MKKTILLFTVMLLFLSCAKEVEKSKFIGNWSTTSDTNFSTNITFLKDLLFIENPSVFDSLVTTEWKVYGTIIKHEGSTWDYKFNSTYDTLWIKHEVDSVYHTKLRKINSNYEFFENSIGLKLKLPQTKDTLISLGKKDYVFPIYLGKQNDSLLLKTDKYSFDLKKLESRVLNYYHGIEENEKDSLKFGLFIDKSVSSKEVDSVKNILRGLPIKKFFRIYESKDYLKEDWKAEIKWQGKFEE